MKASERGKQTRPEEYEGTEVLTIRVRDDLCRAFQRCSWMIINETGRNQMDIMNEMVRDFLIKHGC